MAKKNKKFQAQNNKKQLLAILIKRVLQESTNLNKIMQENYCTTTSFSK